MAENRCGALALEALTCIARAMSRLEVGELGVLSFGTSGEKGVRILHPLGAPFTDAAGPGLVSSFTFAGEHTVADAPVGALLDTLDVQLTAARESHAGGSEQLQQLVLIIAGGFVRCIARDGCGCVLTASPPPSLQMATSTRRSRCGCACAAWSARACWWPSLRWTPPRRCSTCRASPSLRGGAYVFSSQLVSIPLSDTAPSSSFQAGVHGLPGVIPVPVLHNRRGGLHPAPDAVRPAPPVVRADPGLEQDPRHNRHTE
jgi:hypothetical protein